MKRILNFLSYIFLVLAVAACSVELRDKETTKPVSSSLPSLEVLSLRGIEQKLRGLDQPNRYEYHLHWPKFEGKLRISESGRMLAVLSGQDGEFTVDDIEGGAKLNFLIEQIVDGKITANFLVPVTVPRDVELSGVSFLTQDETIQAERVFLMSGAVFYTREHNLKILAKELYSEGALLRNFAESDRVSEREKNGQAGGRIHLILEKASGQLQVELSGQAAGRGRDGVVIYGTGHPGCWGTNGGNGGDAGKFILEVADDSKFRYHVRSRPGLKGLAGARGSVRIETPRSESVFPCYSKVPGADGRDGGPGKVCTKRGSDRDLRCFDL